MSKHGQPMSQTLAQMHLNELKMNDPKLNKMFDKLKKGNTVKIKHSSTLERGKDFIEYIVKSKNVVNKGRVEKITLATKDNPTAVKKFLYKRDGKVTFAVGDMAASIDDIKEKYSIINHEIIEEIEVEELDELNPRLMKNMDDDNLKSYYLAFARDPIKMAPQDREIFKALTPEIKKRKIKFSKSEQDLIKKAMKSAKNPNMYEEVELDEGFSPKEIKMAIGIASDPRYAKGNMTGAVNAIEKMKKGLSKHPQVAAVLKRQNENLEGYKPIKANHYDVKVTVSDKDVAKVKKIISNFKGDIEDVDSDQVDGGGNKFKGTGDIFIQGDDAGKLGMEIAKAVRTAKVMGEEIYKEALDKEDEPKVKEIIKKLKGASDAHAGQAKDLEKAIDEGKMKQFHMMQKDGASAEQIAKALKLDLKTVKELMKEGNDMTEKLTDGNLSLKETVLKMWQEAVSPAQQAAIAISKKEKEKKEEPDEGNAFGAALQAAKEKGEKTFTVAGKEYDVQTEKLVGGQKKLDKDKDGDIDGKDFAMMRKKKTEEFSTPEWERYLQTKKGSLRDAVLQMWGEEVKDDKKTLTKEKKDGKNKMTDTGKEMTPVEMAPTMPKVKNEKNKV